MLKQLLMVKETLAILPMTRETEVTEDAGLINSNDSTPVGMRLRVFLGTK